MKPIKSAEEFRALLDRASKRHEQQGLKNVSLKVIQDEGLRVVDGCLLYKKLVDAQKEINAVVEQLTAVTKWNNELYAKIEVANKILNETPQKSLLKFRLRMVLEIPRKEEPKKHEEEPYYQEVCSVCGWASTPERGMPFGFGGTLDCPECRKVKRHPTLEGCYGSVKSFKVELPQKENTSP